MIPQHNNYAGFWPRFIALAMDIAVILAFISLLSSWFSSINILNTWLFKLIIIQLYFVSLTTIYNQTLGKMIVGIKVRTITDEKPSWEDVLLREGICKGISACLLFSGYLMAAFDPRKRALHDHLTNMVVVWDSYN